MPKRPKIKKHKKNCGCKACGSACKPCKAVPEIRPESGTDPCGCDNNSTCDKK